MTPDKKNCLALYWMSGLRSIMNRMIQNECSWGCWSGTPEDSFCLLAKTNPHSNVTTKIFWPSGTKIKNIKPNMIISPFFGWSQSLAFHILPQVITIFQRSDFNRKYWSLLVVDKYFLNKNASISQSDFFFFCIVFQQLYCLCIDSGYSLPGKYIVSLYLAWAGA